MTLQQINKKHEELKDVANRLEKAMKKFEGTKNVENYLGYETLSIARECVISSMNKLVNYDWQ